MYGHNRINLVILKDIQFFTIVLLDCIFHVLSRLNVGAIFHICIKVSNLIVKVRFVCVLV